MSISKQLKKPARDFGESGWHLSKQINNNALRHDCTAIVALEGIEQ